MPSKTEIDNLIKCITDSYNITEEQLFGISRKAHVAEARQVLCYCLRKNFQLSFPVIGEMLNRDHTTIMHAYNKISQDLIDNKKIQNIINTCNAEKVDYLENDDSESSLDEEEAPSDNQILKYVEDKHRQEILEYKNIIEKLHQEKLEKIQEINQEYKNRLKCIKENKKAQESDYKEAIKSLRKGITLSAENYLSPKNELLEKHNLNDKIKLFLPKYKKNAEEHIIPIKFSNDYIRGILSRLDERNRKIIIDRFGLLGEDLHTLEKISERLSITRERVRQLISKSLYQIYFHNVGAVRQILERVSKDIVKENIISVEEIANNFFEYDSKDKNELIKFILIISSIIKWIKKFEFNNSIYLINYQNEEYVFNSIDSIKKIIKQVYENMPDLVEDKWEYVYSNLKMFEFFKDNPTFLKKDFIRLCYDNYLFESEIVIRRKNDIKKYNITDKNNRNEKTQGVPNEYEIFFK